MYTTKHFAGLFEWVEYVLGTALEASKVDLQYLEFVAEPAYIHTKLPLILSRRVSKSPFKTSHSRLQIEASLLKSTKLHGSEVDLRTARTFFGSQ